MVDVPLSMKEIEVIRFVIERYRKAMIFEIAHTDSRELKKHLQEREDLIQALVQKLDSFSGEPDTLSS
jgi:predicted translin family RNA/ssDNA-binding protein